MERVFLAIALLVVAPLGFVAMSAQERAAQQVAARPPDGFACSAWHVERGVDGGTRSVCYRYDRVSPPASAAHR